MKQGSEPSAAADAVPFSILLCAVKVQSRGPSRVPDFVMGTIRCSVRFSIGLDLYTRELTKPYVLLAKSVPRQQ